MRAAAMPKKNRKRHLSLSMQVVMAVRIAASIIVIHAFIPVSITTITNMLIPAAGGNSRA